MRTRAFVLVCLALVCLGAQRPRGLHDVMEVRHWSYPDYTRVVVELTRAAKMGELVHLPADRRNGRPERLYVDIEGVWVGRRYVDGIAVGDGLLRGVRLGQNTLTRTRVVIDVDNYERHRIFTLSHPDRLVVDVYGSRRGEKPGSGRGGSSPTEPQRDYRRAARTVVLDAGHGGRDPGAIGVGGIREKEVTLALARALRPMLEKRGFEVVLTRDRDRTIELEERTAIAEAARGDLFVSLHANASRRRSLHGIETYYLDKDYERHSVTVAARENGIRPSQVNALQRTLAQLRVSETEAWSARLATRVHSQIVSGLSKQSKPVQDLGVKKGPFYVLFLSDMPAILVEAGFVTNKTEARRLRDKDYIAILAEQIAVGVEHYRDDGQRLARRQ